MSLTGRPTFSAVLIGIVAVIAVILLIGIFTGHDATIYENTPDVPPPVHREP